MRLFHSLIVSVVGVSAFAWDAPTQHPIGHRPNTKAASGSTTSAPSYRDALLSLHRGLVEIPSQSGAEGNVGDWLIDYLVQHNYHAIRQALPMRDNTGDNGRFNVIAWPYDTNASGTTSRPSLDALSTLPPLLVSSHIDVVPPYIPYNINGSTTASETVISGRGTVDAKGSVAAQITAIEELRSAGTLSQGDVLLVYVVGEEDSGDGMKAFSQSLAGDAGSGFSAAIFGEPTENKLACGHKGILGCSVTATGRAGHSGYPWLGKSANDLLMRGLVAVLDAAAAGDLGSDPAFGNTTVNVGTLSGGIAANVIPAAASAGLAIRVAVGPQATGHEFVHSRINDIFASVDNDALSLSCSQGYGIVECNCEVEGFNTITVNYGTDVPNLAGNHTRYLYGPGDILVAHSDDEALTIGDLETAVEGYKVLIKHALSK